MSTHQAAAELPMRRPTPIVLFEKKGLNPVTPRKHSPGAACFDLAADSRQDNNSWIIPPRETVKIETGIAVQFPPGYYGQLSLRSSAGSRGLCIPHGVGIIDTDFASSIFVLVHNLQNETVSIEQGERFAQLGVHIVLEPLFIESLEPIQNTGRGGCGSTGKF